MLLSILIPVYNYDCRQLVHQLLEQLPPKSEILVMDDASTDATLKACNRTLEDLDSVRYWEEKENRGRARVRNALAERARGEWLLFMDCDAQVPDSQYLARYLAHMQDVQVLVGGTTSLQACPSDSVSLRFRYEQSYWRNNTAARRQRRPYAAFTTFNFFIQSAVFHDIRFCEDFTEYGHEDTVFGIELERRGISLLHIDNPLVHCGLDSNEAFLEKTRSAINNLMFHPTLPSRLKVWHHNIERWHLGGLLRLGFRITRPLMERQLTGRRPYLIIFNIYKVGFCLTLQKSKKGQNLTTQPF